MFQYQVDLDPYWIPSTDDEEADDEADDEESEESQEEYEEIDNGFVGDMSHCTKQFSFMAFITAVLRKSLITCSVDRECEKVICAKSMNISWPTDVKHISHVTFDRFNGFLGLPVEFEPEIPTKVPSARCV